MSGKKQHYISVYFQKGWSNDPEKRNGRIYAFEKDNDFPTNTDDNFAANQFHSTLENPETDRIITEDIEPINNRIIKTLRELDFNEKMEITDEKLIIDINYLLISMYSRTEVFRIQFFDLLNDFKKQLLDNIKKIITIENLKYLISIPNPPNLSAEQIEDIKENVEFYHAFLIETIEGSLEMFNVEEMLYMFLTLEKKDIKRFFHSKFIVNEKFLNIIKNRKVFVIKSKENFILSDNLIVVKKDKKLFSFSFNSDNTIYFPISENRIILITNKNATIPDNINQILAKTSYKRIVNKNNDCQNLKKYIGKINHPEIELPEIENNFLKQNYTEFIANKENLLKELGIGIEEKNILMKKLKKMINKKNNELYDEIYNDIKDEALILNKNCLKSKIKYNIKNSQYYQSKIRYFVIMENIIKHV